MRSLFHIEAGEMAWDNHDGWCIEIKLFGLILQFAVGRRN